MIPLAICTAFLAVFTPLNGYPADRVKRQFQQYYQQYPYPANNYQVNTYQPNQASGYQPYPSYQVAIQTQVQSAPVPQPTLPPRNENGKIKSIPLPPLAWPLDNFPGKNYRMDKIGDGVYWVSNTVYNCMFIVTSTGVVVVDTPPTLTIAAVRDAIQSVTNLPVTHFIYSHHHMDHTDGNNEWGNVERIGHEETARILRERNSPRRPVPTTTFKDSMTLQIGGKTIQLDYKGPIHTMGNIFIWLPNERVVMLVDTVTPGWSPWKRLGGAEDVATYCKMPEWLLAYPFINYVGGHYGRVGNRQDVINFKMYMRDLQNNAMKALMSLNSAGVAAMIDNPNNPQLANRTAIDSIIATCADLQIPLWKDKLGGVDIFTGENCDVMAIAQSVDIGMKLLE